MGLEVLAPMLIYKQPDAALLERRLATDEYIGTVKKDGYFYQLIHDLDDNIYLYSRSKSKKTGFYSEKIENVPHIREWATNLPKGTAIVGEIYYPGKTSKDVTKIMGSLPQKAQDRQYNSNAFGGPIHYYIHDLLFYNGDEIYNMPYEERYKLLRQYIENLQNDTIEFVESYNDNLQNNLQDIFDRGEEGMVFKKRSGLYLPGKRPQDNFKVKTEETFDAVIIGFIEPEKQYTGKELESWQYFKDGMPVTKAYYNGWKAGVEIGAFDDEGNIKSIGTISSGMTDYLRQDMAEHPDNYLDKTVEIQAMSVNSDDYTIRHGRLIRVRDDKESKECTLKAIFG